MSSDKVRGAELVLDGLDVIYIISQQAQEVNPEFGNPEYLRGLQMAIDHTKALIRGLKAQESDFPGPRGAEKVYPYKENPLGIKDYVGTFHSGLSRREVTVNVQGVQWDGTEEQFELLREWVEGISPYQGLQYHPERDESLRINGPFLILGAGNDFGDFDVVQPGDFLYLTGRHFHSTSPDSFFKSYREVK